MQLFDARAARVLATICAFVAVGAFLYGVRRTLVLFLFAIFFAYLLEPVVSRIQSWPVSRASRGLAIAETYLCLGVLIGALIVIFGPRLADDSRALTQSLPALLEKVASGKIVWQFGSKHGWSYETQSRLEQFIAAHRGEILDWFTQLGATVAQSLENAVWLVLIPILAAFFLKDGGRFAQAFIDTFDRRDQRRLLRGIVEDLDRMLARFILTQLALAVISMAAYTGFLTAMHYPYALVLGLAGGIMEFIPVAGALMAAVAIIGVGLLTAYSPLWAVLLFLGVWRLCQDYVVSPRLFGRGLKLHPLVAIAAVLMGGELGGILGVYLSIPLAATIRLLWTRWQNFVPESDIAAQRKLAEISPSHPRNRVAG